MKWNLLLALFSIGLVAGDGAWKENYEYIYKFVQKSFFKLSGANDRGIVASVLLTIRIQADNVLIGRMTETELAELGEQNSDFKSLGSLDLAEKKAVLQDVPLNKLFKVYLKNGVIDTLFVDQTMTEKQIKLVKFIVSQFQVDTKAENWIRESANNPRPDINASNAYYMTMESTAIGVCKTSYDISRLPEYLVHAQHDTIPTLFKYAGGEEIIQIIKNTNYRNCSNEQTVYVADRDENVNDLINARIIISGSLDKYTIHSSAATIKNKGNSDYVYLTLESMKRFNEDSSYSPSPRFGNMKNVGNLVQENVYV